MTNLMTFFYLGIGGGGEEHPIPSILYTFKSAVHYKVLHLPKINLRKHQRLISIEILL